MNKLIIIGNLTRDPELRQVDTMNGKQSVCNFDVAVNRAGRNAQGQQKADFFSVTAWGQRGEVCAKYLAKGRKVMACGPVSCRVYQAKDGSTRPVMEVRADDVEFLSSGQQEQDQSRQQVQERKDEQTGYTTVETDELPF